MTLRENLKIKIIKQNYARPEDNFYIYKISPANEAAKKYIQPDKKYHSYSVFANSPLTVGMALNTDIDVKNKGNKIEYLIKKVHYDWPSDPEQQWAFLDRLSTNNNYRSLSKIIQQKYKKDDMILDLITEDKINLDIFNKKQKERWPKFKQELDDYHDLVNFAKYLPDNIGDDMTDNQLVSLSQLVPGNPKQSAEKFLDNPFEATSISGFGFKKVDHLREILANHYPDKDGYKFDSASRIFYGAYDVINNTVLSNGDTFLYLSNFKDKMFDILNINRRRMRKFMKDEYSNPEYGDPNFSIKINDNLVSTNNVYCAEDSIFNYFVHEHNVELINDFDDKLESFLEKTGSELTDEQRKIFTSINENNTTLLVGPGGVGKTWSVGKLIKFVKDYLHFKVVLAAPTGKASQVLSQYTGHEAKTIHSIFKIGNNGVADHSDIDSDTDLLVIDEFSMVYSELMSVIIEAMENNPSLRVLFVGDEFQIPSVGPGNVLHDLLSHNAVNTIKLTKVFRTKDSNGGIASLSQELRSGNVSLPDNNNALYNIGSDLSIQNLYDADELHDTILYHYNSLLKQGADPNDIMVLVPQNKKITGQQQLNIDIQNLVHKFAKVNKNVPFLEQMVYGQTIQFIVGDLIMFNKNRDYYASDELDNAKLGDLEKIHLHNGDTGEIIKLSEKGVVVNVNGFEDNIFIKADDMSELTLAYASTIHKAQGSQAKYGILGIAPTDTYMLNANLLYTGVSRIKNHLFVLGSLSTIRNRSHIFMNNDRNTLLDYFLTNKENFIIDESNDNDSKNDDNSDSNSDVFKDTENSTSKLNENNKSKDKYENVDLIF